MRTVIAPSSSPPSAAFDLATAMADNVALQEEGSPVTAPRRQVKATAEQTCHLQAAFLANAHPTADAKQRLADLTGLSVRWITAWFSRKRRSSGLGATPPAQRSGTSRSGGLPIPFYRKLAAEESSGFLSYDSTPSPPAFCEPSGWPDSQLMGPGIPPGSPPFGPYPPMLDMRRIYPDYHEDISTPSLASALSATSSPFPLTPFSLDVSNSLAARGPHLDKMPKENTPSTEQISSSSTLPSTYELDVVHTGFSRTTCMDWETVLSNDNHVAPARRPILRQSPPFTPASVSRNEAPVLSKPDTPKSGVAVSSSPSIANIGSPVIPTPAAPISYTVRLSDLKAVQRLQYINYLNAQNAANGYMPSSSKTSGTLGPFLSQTSASSPASDRISTPITIKRPASTLPSRTPSSSKKPRLRTDDDKENWPPSSPAPFLA